MANTKLLEKLNQSGRVVVVTGGGYGIGKQVALAFGGLGANVVLAARSANKIADTAKQLKALDTDPLALETDISCEDDVRQLAKETRAKYGRIDVLVNNSAIAGPTAAVPDIDTKAWRETVDINLTGTFFCCKYIGAIMREQKSGHIITVSSVGGRTAYPLRAPYCVTRWGVIGLSHTLAAELGPHGVRVNAVVPGPVQGNRMNNIFKSRAEATGVPPEEIEQVFTKDIPLGRVVTEQEVADAVIFLASQLSAGIQGQIIQVDGGYRI